MLAEINECQEATGIKYPDWGIGYIGGIPNSAALWADIKLGKVETIWKSWAPYYNIHKMFAGLRDARLYANNTDAKEYFLK